MENWIELDQNNLPSWRTIYDFKHPEYGIINGSVITTEPAPGKKADWILPADGRSAEIWAGEFTHYRKSK